VSFKTSNKESGHYGSCRKAQHRRCARLALEPENRQVPGSRHDRGIHRALHPKDARRRRRTSCQERGRFHGAVWAFDRPVLPASQGVRLPGRASQGRRELSEASGSQGTALRCALPALPVGARLGLALPAGSASCRSAPRPRLLHDHEVLRVPAGGSKGGRGVSSGRCKRQPGAPPRVINFT